MNLVEAACAAPCDYNIGSIGNLMQYVCSRIGGPASLAIQVYMSMAKGCQGEGLLFSWLSMPSMAVDMVTYASGSKAMAQLRHRLQANGGGGKAGGCASDLR